MAARLLRRRHVSVSSRRTTPRPQMATLFLLILIFFQPKLVHTRLMYIHSPMLIHGSNPFIPFNHFPHLPLSFPLMIFRGSSCYCFIFSRVKITSSITITSNTSQFKVHLAQTIVFMNKNKIKTIYFASTGECRYFRFKKKCAI